MGCDRRTGCILDFLSVAVRWWKMSEARLKVSIQFSRSPCEEVVCRIVARLNPLPAQLRSEGF